MKCCGTLGRARVELLSSGPVLGLLEILRSPEFIALRSDGLITVQGTRAAKNIAQKNDG